MAFTEQELELARKVKAQGGSKQDFLEVVGEFRRRQQAQPTQTPTEEPIVQETQQRPAISAETLPEVDLSGVGKQVVGDIAEAGVEKAKEFAAGIGQRVVGAGIRGAAGVLDIVGADKPSEEVRKFAEFAEGKDKEILDSLGINTETGTFKAGSLMSDITLALAPTPGGAKLKAADKFIDAIKSPVVKNSLKGLVGAIKAGGDVTKFTVLSEGRAPTKEELGAGVAFAGATTGIGAGTQKLGSKLKVSGLISGAKLGKVDDQLAATKESVNASDWLVKNKIVGSKASQVSKLDDLIKASDTKLQDGLKLSTSKFTKKTVPFEVQRTAEKLDDLFGKRVGFEKEMKPVKKILKGKDIKLKDINDLQKVSGEFLPNFTAAGDELARVSAKENARLYNKVKTFLEKKAKEEGLGINVAALKKDKQVAFTLKNAIQKKAKGEEVAQLVRPLSASGVGGAIGFQKGENLESRLKNAIIGMALGGISQSTFLKSGLGQALVALPNSGKQKVINMIKRAGVVEASNLVKDLKPKKD